MKPSLALMPPGACAGGLAARGRCGHCCHMRDEPGTAPIQLLVWLLVSFKTVVLDPLAAPHLTNLVLRHQLCHETYKEHGGHVPTVYAQAPLRSVARRQPPGPGPFGPSARCSARTAVGRAGRPFPAPATGQRSSSGRRSMHALLAYAV